ncbi:MAG TPA: DNA polymerase I, partial [Candidatus Wirthbacteria bacterium]|nr:DNA polymerase I [Candidatus Wirthbacteria bacterium]
SNTQIDCPTVCVQSISELEQIVLAIKQNQLVVLDAETSSLDPYDCLLAGISLAYNVDKAYYLPFNHQISGRALAIDTMFGDQVDNHPDNEELHNLDWETVKPILQDILEDPQIRKIGHNLKFDALVLRNWGIRLQGYYFDTLLAAYLLQTNSQNLGLKYLAFVELGWQMQNIEQLIGKRGKNQIQFNEVPIPKAADYSGADALATYQLWQLFADRLDQKDKNKSGFQGPTLKSLFYEIEMPLLEVLLEMEFAGIRLDTKYLATFSADLNEKLKVLENQIVNQAGHFFNVNSTKQLQEVLFEEMQIKKTKKIKTGYSTDAQSLESIKSEHPIVGLILEYREFYKIKTTYTEALIEAVNPKTGRLHTFYNQAVTSTGRLSSSNPNLQNIPVRNDYGGQIRKAFLAPAGHKLLAADYSQVEFRILAHMAQDDTMLEDFIRGKDFHTMTAAKIFSLPPERITKDQRRVAKTVNFGVIYGQTKYGLSKQLEISQQEAEDFINNFFASYPQTADYLEKIKLMARTRGYVSSLLGRVRQIPDINSQSMMRKQAAQRMAINMPIQGTAADLMKLAMIKIYEALQENNYAGRLLLQVHDEV